MRAFRGGVDRLFGLCVGAVVAGVLDAMGDGVAGYFANVKREEFFSYHSAVTPWEIDHYLTAF